MTEIVGIGDLLGVRGRRLTLNYCGGLPAEGPLPWQRLPEYKTIIPHLQRKVNGFSGSL